MERETALQTAFHLRPFVADLRSSDPICRRFAAHVLAEYADPRTAEALAHAIGDQDEEVKFAVWDSLTNILDGYTGTEDAPVSYVLNAVERIVATYGAAGEPRTLPLMAAGLRSPCVILQAHVRSSMLRLPPNRLLLESILPSCAAWLV